MPRRENTESTARGIYTLGKNVITSANAENIKKIFNGFAVSQNVFFLIQFFISETTYYQMAINRMGWTIYFIHSSFI